jgi:hypothetical protein
VVFKGNRTFGSSIPPDDEFVQQVILLLKLFHQWEGQIDVKKHAVTQFEEFSPPQHPTHVPEIPSTQTTLTGSVSAIFF